VRKEARGFRRGRQRQEIETEKTERRRQATAMEGA
jgi:hypothetical protein